MSKPKHRKQQTIKHKQSKTKQIKQPNQSNGSKTIIKPKTLQAT